MGYRNRLLLFATVGVIAVALVPAAAPTVRARAADPAIEAPDHVSVSAISDNCVLTTTGAVLCWGQNQKGQLGNGTTDFSRLPIPVTGLSTGVTAIATGGFRCAIQSGSVWCWGRYQPGPPYPEPLLVPEAVEGLPSNIGRIAVGESHACGVTHGGAVWCWGENGEGQLGNGTVGPTPSPMQVVGLSAGVAEIVAGRNHTCARTTAGAVLCWGANSSGQLGNGGGGSMSAPVASGITNGALQVSAKENMTCAVTSDGSGWCWGSNFYGQIGDGTKGTSVSLPRRTDWSGGASISIGAVSSCGVTGTGGVWCWGRNQDGEVGDGSKEERLVPVPVSGLASGVVAVNAGSGKSCAVKSDGTAWCWGFNEDYRLVDGTNIERLTPVQMKFDLAAASVTQSPASASIPEGGGATFTVGVAGNPTPMIRWQALAPGQSSWADLANTTPFNSSPYTGVSTTTLTLTGATRAMDTTRYRAVVTNDFGQVWSAEAVLTVEFPPTIAAQPVDRTIAAGQSTTFAVTAAAAAPAAFRWQVSTNTGATWTDLAASSVYAGTDTATLSLTGAPVSLHHAQYRVVITNGFGTATSTPGRLTVFGPLTATPTALRFGATKSGEAGALTHVTAPQALTLGTTGAATAWTASADRTWVQLSLTSGVGSDLLTVSIVNPGNVLGATTSATALVTLTPSTPGLTPVTVTVSLTVTHAGTDTTSPYGQVDSPTQDANDIAGALALTGWALDDVGVGSVRVYRGCESFDAVGVCQLLDGRSLVYVGDASFLPGARPDVEAAFPSVPASNGAGWGLLVLTPMLPHVPAGLPRGGQGPMSFHVLATDLAGNRTWLGRSQTDHSATRVVLANDAIAKPFGTIDTPSLGATVSGLLHNFGWALTPDTDTVSDSSDVVIPTNGSTMVVYLDGQPVGLVAFNQCRGTVGSTVPTEMYCDDDVANLFGTMTPQPVGTLRTANPSRYRNLDAARGAIGVYSIDTTTLTNGLHTIAWSVTDSQGRTEGIGSRFFTVLNGVAPAPAQAMLDPMAARQEVQAAVWARTGFDLQAPWTAVDPDAAGVRRVTVPELGRLEVAVGAAFTAGYLQVGNRLEPLPMGSSLTDGVFSWTPLAGYLGTYELVFVSPDGRLPIAVTIGK